MENKNKYELDPVAEWLASTGFLFPENEIEYCRFKKLFPSSALLAGGGIDVDGIINGKPFNKPMLKAQRITLNLPLEEYKLVATTKAKKGSNSSPEGNISKDKNKK